MSEPKRFDHLSDGMWQNSAGDYVLHADYARLQAEVERLRIYDVEHWKDQWLLVIEDNNRLQAEVERLRKAGDAMDTFLGPCHASRQWRAAKEGRPNE